MITLVKSIPMGAFLTLLVALFIGSAGASGGVLHVFGFLAEGTRFYWSWPLFCGSTALAWALMLLMRD